MRWRLWAPRAARTAIAGTRWSSTLPSITDPFVLYQANVSRGQLQPDEMQMRAALEYGESRVKAFADPGARLRKVYERVKDYEPEEGLGDALERLQQLLYEQSGTARLSPLEWIQRTAMGGTRADKEARALVHVLSDEQQVLESRAPRGLLLCGDVGTGKSMLMDMFIDALPRQRKLRYHFHALMLVLFQQIHRHHKTRGEKSVFPGPALRDYFHQDYLLLTLARDFIQRSCILAIDEFQLPDMASATILKQFLLHYLRLGGVLLATSNRLPQGK